MHPAAERKKERKKELINMHTSNHQPAHLAMNSCSHGPDSFDISAVALPLSPPLPPRVSVAKKKWHHTNA
jgi:hypothetical protein